MKTPFQPMSPAMLADVKATIVTNRAKSPLVRRLKANALGRDFVVGDIHGTFEVVRQAMRRVGFDKTKDRLFSCGDLVDRGIESETAAKFLAAECVYAVMGNHEDDLIDLYMALEVKGDGVDELPVQALAARNWNGMRWLEQVTPEQRAAVVKAVSAMPLVIELETPRGLVGLIHGEVPIGMNWATFVQGIERRDKKITEACLFGRKRSELACHDRVLGIDRIFCGHTTMFDGAARQGNVFFLDTGAVFSQREDMAARHPKAALTMANTCFATGLLAGPGQKDLGQAPDAIRILGQDADGSEGPFNSSWVDGPDAGGDAP